MTCIQNKVKKTFQQNIEKQDLKKNASQFNSSMAATVRWGWQPRIYTYIYKQNNSNVPHITGQTTNVTPPRHDYRRTHQDRTDVVWTRNVARWPNSLHMQKQQQSRSSLLTSVQWRLRTIATMMMTNAYFGAFRFWNNLIMLISSDERRCVLHTFALLAIKSACVYVCLCVGCVNEKWIGCTLLFVWLFCVCVWIWSLHFSGLINW